jgi:SNF2 family DNA or RNA helicase
MGGYMKRQVKGYRNVTELKKRIQADASIRRKDQTLTLPPEIVQRVPVELEPEVWEMYAKLATELFLEIKNGTVDIKNAAVKVLRLQQLVGGFLKTDDGVVHQVSKAKLNATAERLENLYNADDKVVTFCRFLPELHAIENLRINKHVPTYVVYGKVKQQDRDIMRRKFQKEDGPSLFLCQIATGSLGIPLFTSQEAIFYSLTYQLDHYIQAKGRLHRKGQVGDQVRYAHMLARATVDYDIYGNLQAKKDFLEFLMGKPKALLKRLKEAA